MRRPHVEGDPDMLAAMEESVLSAAERAYIKEEARTGCVQWDLNPPQREAFNHDLDYMRALSSYAERCLARRREQATAKTVKTNAKRKTSTMGRDYILHIARGERTLCNRAAASVNCAAKENEADLSEESGCRECLRRRKA